MDVIFIGLLTVAIALGYLLGVKSRLGYSLLASLKSPLKSPFKKSFIPHTTRIYLRGLNQFLSEQQDRAIDTFLRALEVNNDTVETHFALGSVLRRKGQLERAIRIHQNILQADGIKTDFLPKAHLELALDYDASGLLDRAEVLLTELIDKGDEIDSNTKVEALQFLVGIYEKEAEWSKALEAVESLCAHTDTGNHKHWRYLQGHYCCEMAALEQGEKQKLRWIEKSKTFCHDHPRTLLKEAQHYIQIGEFGPALQKVQSLLAGGQYLQVGLPWLLRCFKEQGTEELACHQLVDLFRQYNEVALIPLITRHWLERGQGQLMVDFVISALEHHQEYAHFSECLKLTEAANIQPEALQNLLEKRLLFKFECSQCGFSGTHWYWCCPACHSWK